LTSSPPDETQATLDRIARLDPALGAFVHIDAPGALAAAASSNARRRAGTPLSPLDGLPVAIKANIAVAGLPWHAGIAAYRGRLAIADADCVARLRAAGAVVLGVLNMHEGALGGTTDNPAFRRTHNPWRPGVSAGGSSGGAGAAVAAGLCAAALGTDTLGSVRLPAAYCGVFGHRPSAGLLPGGGVVGLAPGLDEVGVLARHAADLTPLLACLAGRPIAPSLPPGATIGILAPRDGPALAPQVAAALAEAAAAASRLGMVVREVALPASLFGAVRRAALLVMEVGAAHEHRAALAADPGGFSPAFRALMAWGTGQPPASLDQARRVLAQAATTIRAAFAPCAAVLAPTTTTPPFTFDDGPPRDQADFTALASLAGLAATAFPLGLDADGLPRSIQAMAADDGACLALAARLARPCAWDAPAPAHPHGG
jgi:aspartyl-tRNA(Asn)/glutamyl-tRNA(Gln) amidotransferase subunit A